MAKWLRKIGFVFLGTLGLVAVLLCASSLYIVGHLSKASKDSTLKSMRTPAIEALQKSQQSETEDFETRLVSAQPLGFKQENAEKLKQPGLTPRIHETIEFYRAIRELQPVIQLVSETPISLMCETVCASGGVPSRDKTFSITALVESYRAHHEDVLEDPLNVNALVVLDGAARLMEPFEEIFDVIDGSPSKTLVKEALVVPKLAFSLINFESHFQENIGYMEARVKGHGEVLAFTKVCAREPEREIALVQECKEKIALLEAVVGSAQ